MNDERLSIETDLLTPFDLRQSLEIWPLKYWFIYFIIMIFFTDEQTGQKKLFLISCFHWKQMVENMTAL